MRVQASHWAHFRLTRDAFSYKILIVRHLSYYANKDLILSTLPNKKCSICGEQPVTNVISTRDEFGKHMKFYCEACDSAREYKSKKKWSNKNYEENKKRFASYMDQWPGLKLISGVSHLFQQHSWETIIKEIRYMKMVPKIKNSANWALANRENILRWLDENGRSLKAGVRIEQFPIEEPWNTFHPLLWAASE